MMRFPPRLTWGLTEVLIAQKLFGVSRHPVALRLDLAQLSARNQVDAASRNIPSLEMSKNSFRDLQALALVREITAPLVWIGGDTPLHYPRIGHLTRDIVNHGRTVFIEMDGKLLRRRIHEFWPVSQLYLVLPLHGLEIAHDLRAGQAGNFRVTIESIRAARLSGFHICVETAISPDMEMSELRELADFISKLDVDGWIQKKSAAADAGQVSAERRMAARALIPSRRWRMLSASLDLTRATHASGIRKEKAVERVSEEVSAHEESVRAV